MTDSITWKQLVLGKLNPEDAVANGKVVISEETPKASIPSWIFLIKEIHANGSVIKPNLRRKKRQS